MLAIYPGMTTKVTVTFERREDGGLMAWSDDVPGFVLSHKDPAMVLADVKPALERILSHAHGKDMKVTEEIPMRCEYVADDADLVAS